MQQQQRIPKYLTSQLLTPEQVTITSQKQEQQNALMYIVPSSDHESRLQTAKASQHRNQQHSLFQKIYHQQRDKVTSSTN